MQVTIATLRAGGIGFSPSVKLSGNSRLAASIPSSSDTGPPWLVDAMLAPLDPKAGAGKSRAQGYDEAMSVVTRSERSQRLDAQLRALPDSPGCTCSATGTARCSTSARPSRCASACSSYFRRDLHATVKTAELVERIEEIEFVAADTENEALLLEQNLIKRHRPPFNIRLRDDKSYPYIAVTVGDEYPRVMFTRERHRKGVLYFGPYSSAKKVRETLDVLNRVFPYRPCEGPQPGRRSGVPCLDYHIGRCAAPCVG